MRIRYAKDHHFCHSRMVLDDDLHYFGVKVVAVVLDQVLEPAVEEQEPLLVVVAEVTGLGEAVFGPSQLEISQVEIL